MPLYLEQSKHIPLGEVLSAMQDRIVGRTRYFGVPTQKNPLDFWVYQELLHVMRPDVIVEVGNKYGGSALALAHLLDLLGHGRLIGVDIDHSGVHQVVRDHPRITLIEGDAPEMAAKVRGLISPGERVLVIEDSSHTYENTLAVLRAYASLISPGDYFIVEDSICHHGLDVGPNPGAYEAIEAFLAEDDSFESDRGMESFVVTWNPRGFLRRRVGVGGRG